MGPLLETKLHVPRAPAARIARARLCERFAHGDEAALTVVSAPAGFGKTTAVTEWLDAIPSGSRRRAWLSLDDRDNDVVTFWTYVVAALRTALGDGFGVASSTMLTTSQAPVDVVIATLLNELLGIDSDLVLVLDDYHVITAVAIHESVSMLLERLPPRVRVVIASRVDPPLPLGRLRVQGKLLEVRAGDLRFTVDEAASYLEQASGATLSTGEVTALAERTEGWAAALQLAALSMRGRDDVSSFIAGFAGDDRYIVDYLAEEVLDRQTEDDRRFLLQTSILERLDGPACDAVTDRAGGRATLERLERANLFLVPLDDRRNWYRYHHLFADVLRAHLLDEHPDDVAELHLRASTWHTSSGDPAEGIRHALAAADVELAADLAEAAVPAWRRDRKEATIRHWLLLLPDHVVRKRPVLTIDLVGALASVGELGAHLEERLDDAERLIDLAAGASAGEEDVVVVRTDQIPSLPAAIEMYRAAIALIRGDLDGTQAHGRRALDTAPGDDHLVRAAAGALVGLAAWARGDVEAACVGYSESIDGLRRAGHHSDVLGCSITLADLRLAQGRVHEAMRIYAEGLELGTGSGSAPLRGTADMHVGLADLHRERGELEAARLHLARSAELGPHNGLPQHPYRSRLCAARLCAADGDLDAALVLLDEAERVYTTDFSPSVRPIPAIRAGLLADHGRVAEALEWVRLRGLAADDELDYLGEFEHLILARVLLAEARVDGSARSADDALDLLRRLVVAAESGGRDGDLLQVLVVLALAEEARGRRSDAVDNLERAVVRAEPEGYRRLFLDEGPRLRPLLEAVASRGRSVTYVGALLESSNARPASRRAPQALVDPLSERELDVLRFLNSELTGPEIARELTVSLHTVRSHTKSIYSKLAVTNRRAAVRRAAELALLQSEPHG